MAPAARAAALLAAHGVGLLDESKFITHKDGREDKPSGGGAAGGAAEKAVKDKMMRDTEGNGAVKIATAPPSHNTTQVSFACSQLGSNASTPVGRDHTSMSSVGRGDGGGPLTPGVAWVGGGGSRPDADPVSCLLHVADVDGDGEVFV